MKYKYSKEDKLLIARKIMEKLWNKVTTDMSAKRYLSWDTHWDEKRKAF